MMNPNLYPPLGYTFTGADGVKFRGDGWRDLYYQIKAYRERNGQPPGDVEGEVQAQHCAANPGHCSGNPQPLPPLPRNQTVNNRVLNWFGNRLSEVRRFGQVPKVSREEAGRRAGICAVCPMQISYSHACEACLSSIRSARGIILGEEGSVHRALHPCVVLGEDCQTSIHLAQPASDDRDLPAHCWRKT